MPLFEDTKNTRDFEDLAGELINPEETVRTVAVALSIGLATNQGLVTDHGYLAVLQKLLSHLVSRLWAERDEIPEHISILHVGLRVPLLCMDETMGFPIQL